MKKFILILTAVVLSSIVVFAQATEKKTTPPTTQAKKAATLHYAWMGGKLSNCMGETWEAQPTDVKLNNGMMVTTKGEVVSKDGKKTMLKDGECVDMNGKIMDHKMAHAKDMKKTEMKEEKKKM